MLRQTIHDIESLEWNKTLFAAIGENRSDLLYLLLKEWSPEKKTVILNKRFKFPDEKQSIYPLEFAIKQKLPEMVQQLIQLGANVNIASNPENILLNVGSLLHLAARTGHVEIIKLLLENGADRHWHTYCSYDPAKSCTEMPCTTAFEHGFGEAFIEATGGFLTEHELLELHCIYHTHALPLDIWVPKNKITMDQPLTTLSAKERNFLCSEERYQDFVTRFPESDIWRLFIDGKKQICCGLSWMSELNGNPGEPGIIYLSDDGSHYRFIHSDIDLPDHQGSLIDLSDIRSFFDKEFEYLDKAFQTWKQDPMNYFFLQSLLLKIFSARHQEIHDNQNKIKENGWSGYETREPGCLNSMYRGFQQACLNKSELTAESVFKIHKEAMAHKADFKEEFDTRAKYPLKAGLNFSLLGYWELSSAPYHQWNELVWSPVYQQMNVFKRQGSEQDVVRIIDQYNHSQQNTPATDRESQLKNIILLASGYARLHPREDGNNRTATILLNSELIKHHFLPVILEDPNRLEGFSQAELLEEVYQGMQNTYHVMQYGYYPGGIATAQLEEASLNSAQKSIVGDIASLFKLFKSTLYDEMNEVCSARMYAP